MKAFTSFVRDERGVDLLEYGLLAGLISVVAIATLKDIGTNLNLFLQKVNTQITPAAGQ